MRIIEDPAELDAAYAALAAAWGAWAPPQRWASRDALEPAGEGASYARRDDVHLFLERTNDKIALGAALTERDQNLLRVEFMRDAPARRKRRVAIAADDAGKHHLLLSAEVLAEQDIRDPFRRLAGAPLAKRAEIGGRDYVLLGPFDAPRIADAFLAVAGLSPAFARHIAKLGALAADEDERLETSLYEISRNVARAHKVQRRVVAALYEALSVKGYRLDEASAGPLKADFAMTQGAETLAFEIRGDAEIADLVRGVGQLALAAPRGAGLTRFFVLPAPRDDSRALAPFMPAFEELGVSVLFYDVRDDQVSFVFHRPDPDLPAATRALFA